MVRPSASRPASATQLAPSPVPRPPSPPQLVERRPRLLRMPGPVAGSRPTSAPAVGAPGPAGVAPTLAGMRAPLLALPLALLLLVAACAGPEEEATVLDEDAAGTLAQGADRLAQELDEGDDCGALAEADAMVARARDGVEAGLVPNEVAAEVEAVASDTTDDLDCRPDEQDADADPDPDADSDPDPDPDPGGEDDGSEGRGEGRGGGRDHAPGQNEDAGRSESRGAGQGGDEGRGGGQGRGEGRGQALGMAGTP
jgi:hypothetical protein